MYTPITRYWQQSSKPAKLLMLAAIFLIAAYPIYTNYYYGYGVEQYQRHKDVMARKSMFFNPWQYRILSPMVVESIYQAEQFAIEKPFGPELKIRNSIQTTSAYEHSQKLLDLLHQEGFLTYNIIFILVRLAQHLLIFYLMLIFYRKFVKNDWLIVAGIIFTSFLMANAVNDSDLSFNTYSDVILYLWAGYVIASGKNPWTIVVITVLGAFNRETSLLIPFLFFVSQVKWTSFNFRKLSIDTIRSVAPPTRVFIVTATSTILFIAIFVAIRMYFGYVDQSYWRAASGLEMLKLNLFSSVSMKSYFEMFGTMVVLPLLFLYSFRNQSYLLRVLFIALLPIWFGVHFYSVVAYQSRLFLVPTLLVLLPGFLEIVERHSLAKHTDVKPELS